MLKIDNSQTSWLRGGLPRQILYFLATAMVAVALGICVSEGKWLYLGVLPFVLLVWFYPVQTTFGTLIALVPFEAIPFLNEGKRATSLVFLAGGAVAATLLGLGLVSRRLEKPSPAAIWWVLFGSWAALTALWAVDSSAVFAQIPSMAALVMLYLAAASFRISARELNAVVLLAITGGCAAALFSAYEYSQGTYFRTGVRGSLLMSTDNPNAFAITLLLPASLALGLFWSCSGWKRLTALLVVLLTYLGVLLTMSRGGLLSFAVMLVIHVGRFRRKIGRLLLPLAGLLSLPLLVMPKLFFTRLSLAIATGGAGRTDIWEAGWAAIKSYGLQGAGLNNFPVVYAQFAGMASRFAGLNRDAHNVYLAVAVELGIVGFLLLVAAIWVQFREARRVRMSLPDAQPLLVACEAAAWAIVAAGCFGQILWHKAFWMCWILLAVVTQLKRASSKGAAGTGYQRAFDHADAWRKSEPARELTHIR